MKKTLLITSLATAMGVATTADAAFTAMGDGDYSMVITSGCFTFGDCAVGGSGNLTDNTLSVEADASSFGSPAGSGIVGDGLMGVIDFTLTGGNITVTSFSQDSYLATAGGTFWLRSTNLTTMGGTIDATGIMNFDPSGRVGLGATTGLPESIWNLDDSTNVAGTASGIFDQWTTGTSTALLVAGGFGVPLSKTGSALTDSTTNVRTGTLVVAGNVGEQWGNPGFSGTPYTEEFNVTISLVLGLPNAVDDNLSTQLSTPLNIDIANDLIIPNDTHADATEVLAYVNFDDSLTDAGSIVSEAGGVITYTPNPAFTDPSTDSFTYTITDSNGIELSTATVNITISNAGVPIANADNVAATEDTQLTLDPVHGSFSVPGVVLDSDPNIAEIPNLIILAVDGVSASGGTITQAVGTNILTYVPAADFNSAVGGVDTFNYTIQNGALLSASTTVTVTVAAVNDAPVCSDVSFTTPLDVTFDITEEGLLSTSTIPPLCTDTEDDSLSIATFDATSTSGGTVSSDGAMPEILTYTPAAGFEGTDTFTFTATDGMNNDISRTVTVLVGSNFGNFTMLRPAPDGGVFGGTNDVNFVWDRTTFNTDEADTDFSIMTIASDGPHPFFGSVWTAHHIRVYGPGTYTFDTTCTVTQLETGISDCMNPLDTVNGQTERFATMTIGADQVGAHILFDWSTSANIDVLNVWNKDAPWVDPDGVTSTANDLYLGVAGAAPDVNTLWSLVSTDVNGDGFNGNPMVDGPFIGYFANFSDTPAESAPPPPPITTNISDTSVSSWNLWSLIASLITMLFVRRKAA